MDWICGIQQGIDYIEAHLTEKLDYQDIARQAYSSVFQFQRVFHILCGYTLGEYIRARRLTLAGNELSFQGTKVIDTALKYGYDSPESFARAFIRFHGITPSQAKEDGAQLKSFSRLSVKLTLKGGSMMDYRIEKRPAFQVAEKIKMVPIAEQKRQNMIPDFWTQSQKDGTLRHLCDISGGTLLGICYGNPPQDAEEFAYAIGAVHDKGQAIPDDLQISEIPAHTWAKFCCKGAMPQAIQQLWHRIYTEFFPASEYEPVGDIDLEVYPDGDMDSPDYESEIWIPVRKNRGPDPLARKRLLK